ncbi:MAG: histidine decarboxylase, pyruvoyl type [Eggerthella lenta]
MKNVEERRNRTIAREANHHATMRAAIDKTAISPYDDYCDGYGMPGAYGNGYVSVLKVSAGTVEDQRRAGRPHRHVRQGRAADAYVGQINMLTASSFCGMAGRCGATTSPPRLGRQRQEQAAVHREAVERPRAEVYTPPRC